MLDLSDLYQFVTYADCGTLSAAADKLHISQPTLTRTMHDVEDAFGVPLFHRGKNRIELTDTGEVAVEQARSLLSEAEKAVDNSPRKEEVKPAPEAKAEEPKVEEKPAEAPAAQPATEPQQ